MLTYRDFWNVCVIFNPKCALSEGGIERVSEMVGPNSEEQRDTIRLEFDDCSHPMFEAPKQAFDLAPVICASETTVALIHSLQMLAVS